MRVQASDGFYSLNATRASTQSMMHALLCSLQSCRADCHRTQALSRSSSGAQWMTS